MTSGRNVMERHKVLLLGGKPVASVDIAKYLKDEGCKLYVADYLPSSLSPAKAYADVELDMSTADVPSLCKLVKEEGIDGVVTGVHEFNIDKAMKVADSCGLPYYVDKDVWAIVSDKARFRSYCDSFGIMTPKTEYVGTGKMQEVGNVSFPVIVKPVDNGANIGISICRNMNELLHAVDEATAFSDKGQVIVEDFIEGDEVSVTYIVKDDVPYLVACGLKFNHMSDDSSRPSALADGYVYPAPQTRDYIDRFDEAVRRMVSSLKLGTSTIFFQGIYNEKGFHIFEAGLRLEGTASFRFIDAMTGVNPMKQMVQACCPFLDYRFNPVDVDPLFGGRQVNIVSVICKRGATVASIEGFDELATSGAFIATECRVVHGNEIPDDESLRRIAMRFVFVSSGDSELRDRLQAIKNGIRISDPEGADIIDEWSNGTFSRLLGE